MLKELQTDVLILGAGPAGLAAAIYSARAGKDTIILKGKTRSRLEMAHLIENYPGLPALTGSEMLSGFEKQAQEFGAKIINGDALELALGYDPKMVTTRNELITAKTVILALGRGQHEQSIPNEERLVGMGVSYCATCDGAFFKGKNVIIYGNDEEAVDDALMLKQLGCNTTLITYCKKVKCPDKLIETIEKKDIKYISNARITNIQGESMLTAVEIEKDGSVSTLPADGLFIIQEVPAQTLLKKSGVTISSKDCITVDREMNTNLPGVFAAGDVTCGGLQIAIAVGEGATAALNALKYIRGLAGS
ncbi:MAG: FAD-dependent oxidoreductase [Candidatus Margulisbacteria bacterium]|nr:FAD-dependent oxidoreductase [Candidatus Margulisiibacteriota bacterium]